MKLVLVSEKIKINDYIILWQNYLRNNVGPTNFYYNWHSVIEAFWKVCWCVF